MEKYEEVTMPELVMVKYDKAPKDPAARSTLNGVPVSIAEVMLMRWRVLCRNGTFAIVNTELQNAFHHLKQEEIPTSMH